MRRKEDEGGIKGGEENQTLEARDPCDGITSSRQKGKGGLNENLKIMKRKRGWLIAYRNETVI